MYLQVQYSTVILLYKIVLMEEEQGLVGNFRKDTGSSPGGKSPKREFLRHKTQTFRKTYDVKILVFCVLYITKFVKAHLKCIQRF